MIKQVREERRQEGLKNCTIAPVLCTYPRGSQSSNRLMNGFLVVAVDLPALKLFSLALGQAKIQAGFPGRESQPPLPLSLGFGAIWVNKWTAES